MKKLLIASLLLTPILSMAGTVDDFLNKNPELKGNVFVKSAIMKEASNQAMSLDQKSGPGVAKRIKEALSTHGDELAALAVRSIAEGCKSGHGSLRFELKDKECSIIIAIDDKE